MTKYIFVTGGVVSSIGKGIVSASVGALLEARGASVSIMKFDPYINVDPGTLSPLQHGEVFVTDDGGETDLDLGHYERFTHKSLSKLNSVTTGSVYKAVIDRERKGGYHGQTVQVIPHITNEIKERIHEVRKNDNPDFLIAEIGGTVGDIESQPFIEAIRQFSGTDAGHNDVCYIHVTMLPWIEASSEIKTKPTQHSVRELSSLGIQPDVLVCRAEEKLDQPIKHKLSTFCGTEEEAIISAPDADSIYEVPLTLEYEGISTSVLAKLDTQLSAPDLSEWTSWSNKRNEIERLVQTEDRTAFIGVVGKYISQPDAYMSLVEAINHSCVEAGFMPEIVWIDSESVDEEQVTGVDGLIVPGGFGTRGIEGKIESIRFAREHDIPFLGICVGMQCALIEIARNVVGYQGSNSTEFDPDTPYPVIDLLPGQEKEVSLGGTLRLGLNPTKVYGSAAKLYGLGANGTIYERHRHRYEVNKLYKDSFDGVSFEGFSPDERRVEVIKYDPHTFFIGTQFHPEFSSKPGKPHPLFDELIKHSKQTN